MPRGISFVLILYVNPYTGLPYEYISLINYEDTQLSLLHLVLQGTGWTVSNAFYFLECAAADDRLGIDDKKCLYVIAFHIQLHHVAGGIIKVTFS